MSRGNYLENLVGVFSTSLHLQNSLDEIVNEIVTKCIDHLGFESCTIHILNFENQVLIQAGTAGIPGNTSLHERSVVHVGKGIIGYVGQTGTPAIVREVVFHKIFPGNNPLPNSQLAFPILYHNKVIGVICAEHSQKDFFAEEDITVLQAITSLNAFRIAHAVKENDQRVRSIKDSTNRSDYKLIAMQSQLNPHFTFNSLNVIMSMIDSNENTEAAAHLLKFSKLLRNIIRNSTEVYITLDEQLEMLKNYLDVEKSRYDDKLNFIFDLDPWVDLKHTRVPYLFCHILAEMAVQSIIKFGAETSNHLLIQFKRNNNSVKIVVESHFGLQENERTPLSQVNQSRFAFEHPQETISSLLTYFPHINVNTTRRDNESFHGEILVPFQFAEYSSIF